MCQRHVIRVATKELARQAGVDLAALGYHAHSKPIEDGTALLVVAYRWIAPDQLGEVYDQLSAVAGRLNGKWQESHIAAMR